MNPLTSASGQRAMKDEVDDAKMFKIKRDRDIQQRTS